MHKFLALALGFSITLMSVASPALAGLIPNGDFATGDFTDWTIVTSSTPGSASVQLLDSSYRAVLSAAGGQEGQEFIGLRSSQFDISRPSLIEVDASFSYSVESGGPGVIAIMSGLDSPYFAPIVLDFADGTSGSVATQTYSVLATIPGTYTLVSFVASATSGNLTLIVTNFRVVPIPEPSTMALCVAGLLCLAWRYRGRR